MHVVGQVEAADRIFDTISKSNRTEAPFVLVVGAGFSRGLVPTTREIIQCNLPLWMASSARAEAYEERLAKCTDGKTAPEAAAFWDGFLKRNQLTESLPVDAHGIPQDVGAAYRAVFDPKYWGAVGNPRDARAFQRALMTADSRRLNEAHFLLGSLLADQPGKLKGNDRFRTQAAFSRLIVTTNFDPYLQVALQTFAQLYLMSDTPERGLGDSITEEQSDVIHLVYLHGSVHRRSQGATEADIQRIKRRDAGVLAPVFAQHGVVVIGYSGWDDAIVSALSACETFENGLYWCGLEPKAPEDIAQKFEGKGTAHYVPIVGAGSFMWELSVRLAKGLPLLFEDPISPARASLANLALAELRVEQTRERDNFGLSLVRRAPRPHVLANAQKSATESLKQLQSTFASTPLSRARLALDLGYLDDAIRQCEAALQADVLTAERPEFLLLQGQARIQLAGERWHNSAPGAEAVSEYAAAEVDFKAVYDMADASENRAAALFGLAMARRGLKRIDEAVQDLESAANLPGASAEDRAGALFTCGIILGDNKREFEKAVACYTTILAMDKVTAEFRAQVQYTRGYYREVMGNLDDAILDYDAVIGEVTASSSDRALALLRRGRLKAKRGDFDGLVTDARARLELSPDLPAAAFEYGVARLIVGNDGDAADIYGRTMAKSPSTEEREYARKLLDEAVTERWVARSLANPLMAIVDRRTSRQPTT